MAEVTVKQLAQVVGTPVDKLLVQLGDAGIPKASDEDMISDSEKLTLLTHLRESRGQSAASGASKKITLKPKRTSELKTDASGRNKVNVEVRGRRTYVRPGDDAAAAPETSEVAPTATPAATQSTAKADTAAENPAVTEDAAAQSEVAAPVEAVELTAAEIAAAKAAEKAAEAAVADQVAAQAASEAATQGADEAQSPAVADSSAGPGAKC